MFKKCSCYHKVLLSEAVVDWRGISSCELWASWHEEWRHVSGAPAVCGSVADCLPAVLRFSCCCRDALSPLEGNEGHTLEPMSNTFNNFSWGIKRVNGHSNGYKYKFLFKHSIFICLKSHLLCLICVACCNNNTKHMSQPHYSRIHPPRNWQRLDRHPLAFTLMYSKILKQSW